MENRAEPEHLRAGSTPWQSASQTQIVGDMRVLQPISYKELCEALFEEVESDCRAE
jgi:hypothetical protein